MWCFIMRLPANDCRALASFTSIGDVEHVEHQFVYEYVSSFGRLAGMDLDVVTPSTRNR